MVILHEDHRVIHSTHFFKEHFGEPGIHALVTAPVASAKNRTGMCDVTERPQAFVAKTLIVLCFFFRAEPHPAQCIAPFLRRNAQTIVLIHEEGIFTAASMCDPGSIASLQDWLDGCHQSAGRHYALRASSMPDMHIRFPVGDDEEPVTAQMLAHMHS